MDAGYIERKAAAKTTKTPCDSEWNERVKDGEETQNTPQTRIRGRKPTSTWSVRKVVTKLDAKTPSSMCCKVRRGYLFPLLFFFFFQSPFLSLFFFCFVLAVDVFGVFEMY